MLIVTPRQRLLTTYEPGTSTVVVRGVLWEVDQRSSLEGPDVSAADFTRTVLAGSA